MSNDTTISCAVWHPFASSKLIVDKIGLSPNLAWSRGEINPQTGGVRDRTYCRFELGSFSEVDFDSGVSLLEKFRNLKCINGFFGGGGRIIIYFKKKGSGDIFLNEFCMQTILNIKAEISFRFICD